MKLLKFRVVTMVLILSLFIIVAGCSNKDDVKSKASEVTSPKHEQAIPVPVILETEDEELKLIQDVVKKTVEYAEAEDMEGYLSNLSEVQQANEQGRKDLEDLYRHFDIDYEVIKIDIPVMLAEGTATIKITQRAKALKVSEGYQFADHEAVFEHTVVKESGSWKLAKADLLSVKMLDKDGNVIEKPIEEKEPELKKEVDTEVSHSSSKPKSSDKK